MIILIVILIAVAVIMLVFFNDDLTQALTDNENDFDSENEFYTISHRMEKGTATNASVSVSHHSFSETAVMISMVFNQINVKGSDCKIRDIDVSLTLDESRTVLKALSKGKYSDYSNMGFLDKDGKINATILEEYGEIILILENVQDSDFEMNVSYELKGKGLYSFNSFEVDAEAITFEYF